jgi:prepilin-type N-terminal cleavage/methylation domain-containing protein
MPRKRRHSGFSLLELLIVLAIVFIVSAFAIPNYITYMRNNRINGDAMNIRSEILLAKMRASSNFTWGRVYFDFTAGTYRPQLWCKQTAFDSGFCATANTWIDVAVGAPQQLQPGVDYGTGTQTDPPDPAVSFAQSTLAQAEGCYPGDSTPPDGNPGAGSADANSACIVFNSRGFAVDNTGAITTNHAIYLTNGVTTAGVTVGPSGIAKVWRHEESDTDQANWKER